MDWASFYNAISHGLAIPDVDCDLREVYHQQDPSMSSQTRAGKAGTLPVGHDVAVPGFVLAAGLIGNTRSIGLYDIHESLARNDKFLAMALLLGCAISNLGTSAVHVCNPIVPTFQIKLII